MNIEKLDLSGYDKMHYDEKHTCHVLIWGETTSVICVDLAMWRDVRTVDTASLHKTPEEYIDWKYNKWWKPGTLVGFHETSNDWGVGVVVEVERIGSGVKLLVGEEIRSIEHHRIFKLREGPQT